MTSEDQRYLLARIKTISDPGLGKNISWLGRIWLYLFAKLPNENTQIFVLLDIIAAPDSAEQHSMGQNLSRMSRQKDQQIIFLWRQMYFVTLDRHVSSFRIDSKIADVDDYLRLCFYRWGGQAA